MDLMRKKGDKKKPKLPKPLKEKRKEKVERAEADEDDEDEDPYIKAENMEIKRLEKLLGLKKTTSASAAEKLNKEYMENEGMEEGFGDFLLGLDSLASNVKKYKKKNKIKSIKTAAVSIDEIDPVRDEEEISLNTNRSDLQEHTGPSSLGSLTVVQEDSDEEAPDLVECDESDAESDQYSDFDAEDLPEDEDDFLEDEEGDEMGSRTGSEEDSEDESDEESEEDEREYMLNQLIDMFISDHKGREPDSEELAMLEAQVDDMLGLGELDSDVEVEHSLEGKQGSSDSDSDVDIDSEEDEDGQGSADDEEGSESEGSYDEDVSVSDRSDESGEAADVDSREGTFYTPKAGEDIYGRVIDTNDSNGAVKKYIPPGKRAQMGMGTPNNENESVCSKKNLQLIDNDSELVKTLRRNMNGFLNRLSDQSKDAITKSIKQLFEKNSRTITNHVFRDSILAICGNSTQVMSTLIPLYSAILAALHCTVSIDIGAFIVEHVVLELVAMVDKVRQNDISAMTSSEAHALISDKKPMNYLLLVCFLYNMRIIHHTLLVDILYYLLKANPIDPTNSLKNAANSSDNNTMYNELEMELIVLILTYCGSYIRQDDPACILHIFNVINGCIKSNVTNSSPVATSTSRLKFLMKIIGDVKNNKSMLSSSNNTYGATAAASLEETKRLRKWLGLIKQQLSSASKNSGSYNATASSTGNVALTFTLQDLMDAETRGRWWKAGASWAGKREDPNSSTHNAEKLKMQRKQQSNKDEDIAIQPRSSEEEVLFQIASKMRGMGSGIRRNIFVTIMSALDLDDAFERILHLKLNSKQDREVVRVIIECCISERPTVDSKTKPIFNRFYAELSILLCNHNRQYRTSFQYAFWDIFKQLKNGGCEDFLDTTNCTKAQILSRKLNRYVNLGKFIAVLVKNHTISLVSVLKTIDIQDLSNPNPKSLNCLVVCLSCMFIDILYDQNSNASLKRDDSPETPLYETVFDRISTSRDYNIIRESCIYFLSKYMNIENNMVALNQCMSIYPYDDSNVLIVLKKRIKSIIKLLESMSVLDMVVKNEDDEERDEMTTKSHKNTKPKRRRAEDEATMTMSDLRDDMRDGIGGGLMKSKKHKKH